MQVVQADGGEQHSRAEEAERHGVQVSAGLAGVVVDLARQEDGPTP